MVPIYDANVRKEALHFFANAFDGGSVKQIETMARHGCVRPMLHCLTQAQAQHSSGGTTPINKPCRNVVAVVSKALGTMVRKLSCKSNNMIDATALHFHFIELKQFYVDHKCVELLIVLKRLLPQVYGHLGIRGLMQEYLVGMANVFDTVSGKRCDMGSCKSCALAVQELCHVPFAEQKNMIGGRLHSLIRVHQPKLAGKITEMLLEMDNDELLYLLTSSSALKEKVDEVVNVLR